MTIHSDPVLSPLARSFPRIAGDIGMLTGCLGLIGWVFDVPILKSVFPGLATMKANTALAFVFLGMSLRIHGGSPVHARALFLARIGAGAILFLSLLTLCEYGLHWNLGIDNLLLKDLSKTEPFPGRMAQATALCFVFLSASLLLLNVEIRRDYRLAPFLVVVPTLVSWLAIIGYLYGVRALYSIGPYSTMAVHTALTMAVLCLGVLGLQLEHRPLRLLISEGAGGGMVRRLLWPALGLPLGLGWLWLAGQHADFYQTEFGAVLMMLSLSIILTGLVWRNASVLERADSERRGVEAELRRAHAELERRVAARTTELARSNEALRLEIAERQHIEAALRVSEARLRTQYRGIPIPTFTWQHTPDGFLLVDYNDAAEALTSDGMARFLGKTAREVYAESTDIAEDIACCFREKTTLRRERFYRLQSTGEEQYFAATLAFVPPDLVIVHTEDITARKLAEDALRASEEKYHSLFEQSLDGVLLTTPDGGILAANPTACQIFGRSEEEICRLGRECVVDMSDPRLPLMLAERARTGKFKGEILHLRKDGSQFPADVSCAVFTDKNGVQKTCVVIRDMTERKRLEQALHASEKLAATGRMAARIAHEISNPLAGIKNAFLLVKGAISPTHPHYEFAELIEGEIDRIARIVRQMYDLYRPTQDVARAFDVTTAIRDVLILLQAKCREHDVTIVTESQGGSLPVVLPEMSIRQVLFNLLTNAIEASPPGGVVRIEGGFNGEQLYLAVSDQGGGIPEAMQSQIFEPFFTTKEGSSGGGLGLGLAVSKSLAEAMGGALQFASVPGQGTVFQLTVPGQIENAMSKEGGP